MKNDLRLSAKINAWDPKDLLIPVPSVLSPSEQYKLLIDFNNSFVEFPQNKSVVDLFEEQVAKTPDNIAIVFEDQLMTYRELNARANQLGHYLVSKGVTKESLVPICVERSPAMLIGILAILKTGGAYVPIDPEYPLERIKYMLDDTRASIAVSSDNCRAKLSGRQDLNIIGLEDFLIINQSIDNLNVDIQPQNLAYIIYTSGSTGNPKGVMIEHKNAYLFICWSRREFAKSRFEIVYACTSMCFDLSVFEMFYPLSIGKPIRILVNGMFISDHLHKDSSVLINTVPSVINNLLKQGTDLTNISVINMAGEPVSWYINQSLDTDRIEVRNLYGPTETTTYSTMYRLQKNSPVLIGRPIANTGIYILNNNQRLAPIGAPGEICIGGVGVTRGYLNNDELSAKKFTINPFDQNKKAKIYRTGDLGRWLPDGNIEYLGRLDDQVKIRGYRIELGEIETALEQSKLFSKAVVLAKEDKEGNKRLVAYVVPVDNDFNKEEILYFLRNKLPEYMVPAFWVDMPVLPLTPNGKIDKKALPDPDINELLNNQYADPRNDTEQRLVTIWQNVLTMDRVGINDSFFELGGDSIVATRAVAIISKNLELEITVKDLLFHPTIAELSRFVSVKRSEALLSAIRFGEEDPDSDGNSRSDKNNSQNPGADKLFEGLKRKEKSLIAIQKQGNNIPFFAIPGYFQFRQLAFYLGKDQPFYGFEPSPYKNIKDVALHFISEMKEVQPTGPYILCGFCNMGRIALEMASVLIARGESVPLVVLMESYAPEAELSRLSRQYLYNKSHSIAGSLKEMSGLEKIKSVIAGLKRVYHFIFEKEKYLNDGAVIDQERVYINDSLEHTIQSYPGKVALFKAKDPLLNYSNDPQMGWSKYITGSIEAITINGDHQSIFKEPGVKQLATELERVLGYIKDEIRTTGIRNHC